MSYELTANIIDIMDTQTFNKGFKKREFVVETSGKFPQKILFQTVQDKVDMLDSFNVDDTVTVSFEVKGREWNGKYFNSLEAWRIIAEKRAADKEEEANMDPFDDPELFPEKATKPISRTELEDVPEQDPDDDLPF